MMFNTDRNKTTMQQQKHKKVWL